MFILACILYTVLCLILYVIHFCCYDGIIQTPLVYVAFFPPFALIVWVANRGDLEGEEDQEEILRESGIYKDAGHKEKKLTFRNPFAEWSQAWKSKELSAGRKTVILLGTVIILAATVFMIYELIINPFTLILYFYFAILLVIAWYVFTERRPRRRLSSIACVFFLILILVTVGFILFADPLTVEEGEDLLAEEGYENIYYEKTATEEVLEAIYDQDPTYSSRYSSCMDYYLYRCEQEGEEIGVAVSVVDHTIVAAEELDNESGLNFYMDFD